MSASGDLGFGLQLLLDDAAASEVRHLWEALDNDGLPNFLHATHDRHEPHVTLTVIDSPPDDSELKRLERLRSSVPKKLSFNYLGAFLPRGEQAGELFLGLGLDRSLLSCYSEVQQVLKFERHDPDYALGTYVARCPLSDRFESAEQLTRGIVALNEVFQPFQAEVKGLAFVEVLTGMAIPVW